MPFVELFFKISVRLDALKFELEPARLFSDATDEDDEDGPIWDLGLSEHLFGLRVLFVSI